ncbi:MAG: hypothetical protein COX57_01275 [Alphaproteobacteria bacterium CG_4_10_14_0_2_um_filter_63_37]|nr:MAG: hypothetical protein COX57_01275 [Alphaproteobacteria bacterium CG_4_10_14_0_2_um_filter_63_37]
MIEANAWYFDRDVPYRTMVRLLFEEGGRLRIEGEGIALDYPLSDTRFTRAQDGHTRIIELPDGSHCESLDIEHLEAALKLHGLEEELLKTAGRLKGKGRWIAAGGGGLVLILAALVLWVLPPWAEQQGRDLPATTVQALSQRALGILAPQLNVGTLSTLREAQLTAQWRRATTDIPEGPYPLIFRAAPKLGPFIFALPDGTFVVTDALLQTLDDDSVLALLLHELGHVQGRHALATVWRDHPFMALTRSIDQTEHLSDWAGALLDLMQHGPYPPLLERQASDFAALHMAALGLSEEHWSRGLEQVLDRAQRGNFPLFYSDLHPGPTQP